MITDKAKRDSILISYIVGAPIGLITVFLVTFIPVMLTGEGLATIVMIGLYRNAVIGLLISFLFALGYAANISYKDFRERKSLLLVSLRYSLVVNSIIWTIFLLISTIENFRDALLLAVIPSLIAFAISFFSQHLQLDYLFVT